jgi:hypothetical protein
MKKSMALLLAVLAGTAFAQEDNPTPVDLRIAAQYMEDAAERRTERLWTGLILGGIGTVAVLDDGPHSQAIGAGFFAAAGATMITFEFIIVSKDRKAARALLHKPFCP